jgi:hypothetical protein
MFKRTMDNSNGLLSRQHTLRTFDEADLTSAERDAIKWEVALNLWGLGRITTQPVALGTR